MGLVPLPFWLKAVVAGLLVVGYARYVRLTLVSGGHLEDVPETLLALLGGRTRRSRRRSGAGEPRRNRRRGALLRRRRGARGGGAGVAGGLDRARPRALATELPEKFNSIFWIRDGKDTLALGNMTGDALPEHYPGLLRYPLHPLEPGLFEPLRHGNTGSRLERLCISTSERSGKLRAGLLMVRALLPGVRCGGGRW